MQSDFRALVSQGACEYDERSGQAKACFVLGYDECHGDDIQKSPDAEQFALHPLLRSEDLIHQENYAIEEKIEEARQVLHDFDGPIDAITWHQWDCPVTSMAAVLCEEFNLPGPSLQPQSSPGASSPRWLLIYSALVPFSS